MTLPNRKGEAPAGSAEEARLDAEQYAADAAEGAENATTVAQALVANTHAQLAVAARLGQLSATLEALPEVVQEMLPVTPAAMLGKLLNR